MAINEFSEEQRIKLRWIWIIFISIYVFCIWAIIQQEYFDQPFGSDKAPTISFIAIFALMLILNVLIGIAKLKTRINKEGIYYRFKPFHLKQKMIEWSVVSKYWIREYKPFKEYGGYGIQTSLRNGKAINVSGTKGLQLELTFGKKILIGTQKPKELERFLKKLKQD